MAGTPAVVQQVAFRALDDTVELNSGTFKNALNENFGQEIGKRFRLRFAVAETNGGKTGNTTYGLQWRYVGGGSFNDLSSNTSEAVHTRVSPYFSNRSATTQVISSGSFVAGIAVATDGANVTTGFHALQSQVTEFEWNLRFNAILVNPDDQFEFRIVRDGTTVLETYTNTPIVTALEPPPISNNTSGVDSSTASHVVNLPAGIAEGDLLYISLAAASDGLTFNTPTGWTQIYNVSSGIFHAVGFIREADGNEGLTVTVSSPGFSGRSTHVSYRFQGMAGAQVAVATATGSGTQPNPPELAPHWGNADIWFATAHIRQGQPPPTPPTNYTDLIHHRATATTNFAYSTVASARREINASSEDPGVFTFDFPDSAEWVAVTFAVEPAGAEGEVREDLTLGFATASGRALVADVGKAVDATLVAGSVAVSGRIIDVDAEAQVPIDVTFVQGSATALGRALAVDFAQAVVETLVSGSALTDGQPLSVGTGYGLDLQPGAAEGTGRTLSVDAGATIPVDATLATGAAVASGRDLAIDAAGVADATLVRGFAVTIGRALDPSAGLRIDLQPSAAEGVGQTITVDAGAVVAVDETLIAGAAAASGPALIVDTAQSVEATLVAGAANTTGGELDTQTGRRIDLGAGQAEGQGQELVTSFGQEYNLARGSSQAQGKIIEVQASADIDRALARGSVDARGRELTPSPGRQIDLDAGQSIAIGRELTAAATASVDESLIVGVADASGQTITVEAGASISVDVAVARGSANAAGTVTTQRGHELGLARGEAVTQGRTVLVIAGVAIPVDIVLTKGIAETHRRSLIERTGFGGSLLRGDATAAGEPLSVLHGHVIDLSIGAAIAKGEVSLDTSPFVEFSLLCAGIDISPLIAGQPGVAAVVDGEVDGHALIDGKPEFERCGG